MHYEPIPFSFRIHYAPSHSRQQLAPVCSDVDLKKKLNQFGHTELHIRINMVSGRLSVHWASLLRLDEMRENIYYYLRYFCGFLCGSFNLYESHSKPLKTVMPECQTKRNAISATCIDWDGGWGDTQSHGKSVFNEPWRLFLQCGLLNNNFGWNLFDQSPLSSASINRSYSIYFGCAIDQYLSCHNW